jgi:hypothetical protein
MPAAILLIVLGGTLAYSAFKGISIPDVFGGVLGDNLDPHGSKPTTGTTTDSSVTGTPAGLGNIGLMPKSWCSKTNPGVPCTDFATSRGDVLNQLANAATNQFNLTITATTNGVHVGDSKHYLKRAFDAAGSPADMAAYYDYAHSIIIALPDGELFYDPKGGVDSGSEIGAIGGHGDHVHSGI